ncbi:MAG: hypothetical protein HY698_06190 [Deltaproteobacteria bacterium]|nr:hypothetical protein [Deltaproteobacteria bacterium]
MKARGLGFLALLVIGAALVAHSLYFDFVCDDAYISFVFSRNFAEHNQLVFNLGDKVEGYTNFLWTLGLGLLMKVGIQPEFSSRALGTLFAMGTLLVVTRLAARSLASQPGARGEASLWHLLPAALLAASSGFACWASGGLETQMFTFFVILGVSFLFEEAPRRAGVALALAAMTRPEGGLVMAVAFLHRVIARVVAEKKLLPGRDEVRFAGSFLCLYAPFFAWRWWTYGWPFPNTFYVKAGGTPTPEFTRRMWESGLYFAWQWATQSKAIYAVPVALVGLVKHPRLGSFVLLLSSVYLGYTIKVGGDFMGLHRFVMPLFVTTALIFALGLRAVVAWFPARIRRVGGASVAAAVLGLFTWTQADLSRAAMIPRADHGIDRPGYLKLYAHDRGLIGKALASRVTASDFAIVGGAGVQPYYARLRAIDVFGLVSEEVAHEVPPTNPRPGHQKWAPAPLLLKYNPSFIFHCYDLHRAPERYHLCGEAGYFQANGYEPVTMHVPGLKERGEYYTFLKRKDRAWP